MFDDGKGEPIPKDKAAEFHNIIAKGLFTYKRARPYIHLTIVALCTHVQKTTTANWKSMILMLKYINVTRKDKLVLSIENIHIIKWYAEAPFSVNPDFLIHTGGIRTLGGGATQYIYRKKNINAWSSTEVEIIGADDTSNMILWTQLLLEYQGYDIDKNRI